MLGGCVTSTASQTLSYDNMSFITIWASVWKCFATISLVSARIFSVGGQPGLPSKHGVLLESIIQSVFYGFVILV